MKKDHGNEQLNKFPGYAKYLAKCLDDMGVTSVDRVTGSTSQEVSGMLLPTASETRDVNLYAVGHAQ